MAAFENNRQRASRGFVEGDLRDPGSGDRVRYRTAGGGNRTLGGDVPQVNWTAMGMVPVAVARRYAQQILAACEEAEVEARPFEPNDEVSFDTLKPLDKAFVLSISDDGFMAEVECGVPGPTFQDTRHVETIDCAKLERVR